MQATRIPPSNAHPPGAYDTLHIGPADGPGVCVYERTGDAGQRCIWRFAPSVQAAENYLARLRAGLVEVYTCDNYEPSRRADVSADSAR